IRLYLTARLTPESTPLPYTTLFRSKPPLDSASVNKALKEYLTQQAKLHIRAGNNGYFLPHNRMLNFQETDIDPRKWFGFNGEERSEEHTSELQSRENLVCRLLLEKK